MSAPDSVAFQRWFGDSKIVDSRGRPLVVYHGTKSADPIDVFRPGRVGNLGPGIYFTPDRKGAVAYAGSGGHVIAAYLRAEKPLKIRSSLTSAEELWGRFPAANDGASIEALRAAGYDAVWAVHVAQSKFGQTTPEIVVYDPRQIKAVDNRGTFDPADPHILHGDPAPNGGARVFVYGSLLSGLHNHGILVHHGARLIGRTTTTEAAFTLYSLGPYPAVVSGHTRLHGEVYEISADALVALDRLEGVPHHYVRERIETGLGGAWIYLYAPANRGHLRGAPIVPSGDWRDAAPPTRGRGMFGIFAPRS